MVKRTDTAAEKNKFYFEKTDTIVEKSEIESIINEREDETGKICDSLFQPSVEADAEKMFNQIEDYINNHERFLYSTISNYIFHEIKGDGAFGTFNHNILLVFEQLEKRDKEEYGKDNYIRMEKSLLKIYDHVNLAYRQFADLKETEDEFNRKVKKSIEPFEAKLTREMSAQLLTIVSIFTALAFLLFGGITSLDNLFAQSGMLLSKILIIGLVWGLCMLNLIFVFLVCVSKMTKQQLEPEAEYKMNTFQRYPVIWWTNLIILSALIIFIWVYYSTRNGIMVWLNVLCAKYPARVSIIGTIAIGLIIGGLIALLRRKINDNKDHQSDTTRNKE